MNDSPIGMVAPWGSVVAALLAGRQAEVGPRRPFEMHYQQ